MRDFIIMKHVFIVLVAMNGFTAWSAQVTPPDAAITYKVPQGRLGDRLLVYAQAKYVSRKLNIPLIFKPFVPCDLFMMSRYEQQLQQHDESYYTNIVPLRWSSSLPEVTKPRTLFIVDGARPASYPFIRGDAAILKEIRNMFAPAVPITYKKLPEQCVSVAVHVRKGSGCDIIDHGVNKGHPYPTLSRQWPLRFPPEHYYVDQLTSLTSVLAGRSMYVCIFTDDRNPAAIMERFRKLIPNPCIEWDYSRANTQDQKSVIDDLFDMSRFDCLIRGQSNFAIIADIIGNHPVIIYPSHYIWRGDKLIITEARALVRNSEGVTIGNIECSKENIELLESLVAASLANKGKICHTSATQRRSF